MTHKIIITATIIALIFTFGCTNKNNNYNATGSFEATEVIVSSEVTGRILDFAIIEGATVSTNDIVGLIDSTQLSLQKIALKNNIKALESSRPDATSQLAPLEEQLSKQKREKQRIENLLKANAATERQLDDITSLITITEKQLSAQKLILNNSNSGIDAQILAAKAQLAQIENQISKSIITSPITGVISAKYAQQGELAMTGKPLMKVSDINNTYLKAYLTSSQLRDIKLGQKVKVFADFGSNKQHEYEGDIIWISERSEFTPKNIVTSDDRANMVYAIKIAIINDGFVKIGMYGGVRL